MCAWTPILTIVRVLLSAATERDLTVMLLDMQCAVLDVSMGRSTYTELPRQAAESHVWNSARAPRHGRTVKVNMAVLGFTANESVSWHASWGGHRCGPEGRLLVYWGGRHAFVIVRPPGQKKKQQYVRPLEAQASARQDVEWGGSGNAFQKAQGHRLGSKMVLAQARRPRDKGRTSGVMTRRAVCCRQSRQGDAGECHRVLRS